MLNETRPFFDSLFTSMSRPAGTIFRTCSLIQSPRKNRREEVFFTDTGHRSYF